MWCNGILSLGKKSDGSNSPVLIIHSCIIIAVTFPNFIKEEWKSSIHFLLLEDWFSTSAAFNACVKEMIFLF